MRLGKRLKQIDSMVGADYSHIWDCCCDHGLLGAALLARGAAAHIHFVDRVPELMRALENKLQRFFPATSANKKSNLHPQWYLHCVDVTLLPFNQNTGKQLVIIAGVGGDLMTVFIREICQRNPGLEVDFLLCPVHHQYTLRQQLIQLDFSLTTEILISENRRFYEILLVSSRANPHTDISPVGSLMWHCANAEQRKVATEYLRTTLAHYERAQLNHHNNVQDIIAAYQKISL